MCLPRPPRFFCARSSSSCCKRCAWKDTIDDLDSGAFFARQLYGKKKRSAILWLLVELTLVFVFVCIYKCFNPNAVTYTRFIWPVTLKTLILQLILKNPETPELFYKMRVVGYVILQGIEVSNFITDWSWGIWKSYSILCWLRKKHGLDCRVEAFHGMVKVLWGSWGISFITTKAGWKCPLLAFGRVFLQMISKQLYIRIVGWDLNPY